MKSISGKLNVEELQKWGLNTLKFFAPAILIFLFALQNGTPMKDALNAIYLWLINVTIDLITKLAQGE